jgi:hypothetical protein
VVAMDVIKTNSSASAWLIGAVAAISLGTLSIPSFSKNNYPNILGLIGLILNLMVLVLAILSIVNHSPGSGHGLYTF